MVLLKTTFAFQPVNEVAFIEPNNDIGVSYRSRSFFETCPSFKPIYFNLEQLVEVEVVEIEGEDENIPPPPPPSDN